MSGINADVRDIVQELDADGGGYQTKEAANLLVHRYVEAGICDDMGDPKPKVRGLMRMGASVAFKSYKSDTNEDKANRERGCGLGGWRATRLHRDRGGVRVRVAESLRCMG